MRILVIGNGGREKALAWRLAMCPGVERVHAPWTGDFEACARFCRDNNIDLLVVGPEGPLIDGIADYVHAHCPDTAVFGPDSAAARLEGDKAWAKEFMMRHGIPTAPHTVVDADTYDDGCRFLAAGKPPYVLKATGPAGGKGTVICHDYNEAADMMWQMLDGKFGNASRRVVIERFLDGRECSVFVITDGTGRYVTLPVAKDYKRAGDGDSGPNTGGMGSVSPVPFVTPQVMEAIDSCIVQPTVQGLADDGIQYRGVIYFGLIVNADGVHVLEYNVRFGDPETQSMVMRTAGNLASVMAHAAQGCLSDSDSLHALDDAAVTVVVARSGYPGATPGPGDDVDDTMSLADGATDGVMLWDNGTAPGADGLPTPLTGVGRAYNVVATGQSLDDAVGAAYDALRRARVGKRLRFRNDIGADVIG